MSQRLPGREGAIELTPLLELALILGGIGSIATSITVLIGCDLIQRALRQKVHTGENAQSPSFIEPSQIGERFYKIRHATKGDRVDFGENFFSNLAPTIEKWLVYPELISDAERNTITRVDCILNLFEQVAHIYRITKDFNLFLTESPAFLDWFFEIMANNDHAILRRYLLYNYGEITKLMGLTGGDVYLAVYGTLLSGENSTVPPEIMRRLRQNPRGRCIVRGKLHAVGPNNRYPGLTFDPTSQSSVIAELVNIGTDDSDAAIILKALDRYEKYDPNAPDISEYVRRYVIVTELETEACTRELEKRTIERSMGAWVYIYNRAFDIDKSPQIAHGDWRSYIAGL